MLLNIINNKNDTVNHYDYATPIQKVKYIKLIYRDLKSLKI